MLILRLFCENSPRIIDASGADPAVLKTESQALVCQFLLNLYTNFTKLSNTPLIRQCALMGHYQNTRIFSCSYFGDIKYFRSRFALAY